MKNRHSILFSLEDDALVIANTGRPFDRKGVISICKMGLSSKDADENRGPEDDYTGDDHSLVDAILREHLNTYRAAINRLGEDVNHENRIESSYDGRFVLELLQNADDAAKTARSAAQQIGAKGVGFKSVLEITKEPEVYSGKFGFHFSYKSSQEKLQEALGNKWKTSHGIPVCRLPHNKTPDSNVQKLLDDGYVTVIRLPLIPDKRKYVKTKLDQFAATTLLFCRHLDAVEMRLGENVRSIQMIRSQNERTIELRDKGETQCWKMWREQKDVAGEKQLSVSICLPAISEVDSEKTYFLHVFFPTTERLHGVHALVHASCVVGNNRQHLAPRQVHSEEICEMLKSMVKQILLEISPSVALSAFGRATVNADDTMIARLEKSIAEAVRETAFIPIIGGGLVKPADACLWKHGLGSVVDPDKVHDKNLCAPEIQSDKDAVAILDGLCARDVGVLEHANILKNCKNATKRECVAVWAVAQSLMQKVNDNDKDECGDTLRKTPFWLTSAGHVRAIDGNIPLIVQKPEDFPDWLSVDVVENGFLQLLGDKKSQLQKDENWHDALSSAVAPVLSKQYFAHILLPYCKEQSHEGWKTNGWKILEMTLKWGDPDDVKPLIIGSGDAKEQRAKIMHLPVGKGAENWMPAWRCYAGAEWGGLKMFNQYFASSVDRFLLSPPENWITECSTDMDRWKGVLSWLGCSWTPKLVREEKPHSNRPSSDTPSNTGWIDEFSFEHFEEMLSAATHYKRSDYMALLAMMPEMHQVATKNQSSYIYYYRNYKRERFCESYALIQLKQSKWVPCKRSVLVSDRYLSPADAYLPDFDFDGLLPAVDKGNLDDQTWHKVSDVLVDLGAQNHMPKDVEKLVAYMQQLSDYAKGDGVDLQWSKGNNEVRSIVARAAIAIFQAYPKENPLNDDAMVPYLIHTNVGEEIRFEKAKNVYWADESYFDKLEVRRKILANRKPYVFFRFLRDGEGFGLKALSTFLEMEPNWEEESQNETTLLRDRYEERRLGLIKVAGASVEKELLTNLDLRAHRQIKLTSPKLEINPEIQFWKSNQAKTVRVNMHGGYIWRNLAAALSDVGGCKSYKSDFEHLLEGGWDDFLNRLRDDYGLTEESLEEMKENIPVSEPVHTPPVRSEVVATDPGHFPATGEINPEKNAEDIRQHAHRSMADAKKTSTGGGNGGKHGGGYSKQSKETGDWGEQILFEWLCEKYGHDHVTNMNINNPQNPGYDILVTPSSGENIYYECKAASDSNRPSTETLTEVQYRLATEKQGRYVLAVVYDPNAPQIDFFPDPAGRLKCTRTEYERISSEIRYSVELTDKNCNDEN